HTAAILSFMVQDPPVPIVMVGSQRSSDRPSSDAALNLIHAVHAAGRGDVAAVGVHALQVAAVAELVDPGREHPPAVGVWVVHQRVRGLLARCPDPVGEHHLGGAGCRVGFGVGSQGGLR
ncbi:MAG TPA: asparaginase domain-containing protein, partial [Microthrixaceae bacterium]|nr:asparaginase domain-containing protein [Microthrixaceae bacterium]